MQKPSYYNIIEIIQTYSTISVGICSVFQFLEFLISHGFSCGSFTALRSYLSVMLPVVSSSKSYSLEAKIFLTNEFSWPVKQKPKLGRFLLPMECLFIYVWECP